MATDTTISLMTAIESVILLLLANYCYGKRNFTTDRVILILDIVFSLLKGPISATDDILLLLRA